MWWSTWPGDEESLAEELGQDGWRNCSLVKQDRARDDKTSSDLQELLDYVQKSMKILGPLLKDVPSRDTALTAANTRMFEVAYVDMVFEKLYELPVEAKYS